MGPMGGFLHSECEFFAKGLLPFWIPCFLLFTWPVLVLSVGFLVFGFLGFWFFGLSAALGGSRALALASANC